MRISFGPFELDGGTRQLLKDGHGVHLSPKALDLLLILAGGAPNALSKRELQELLWPKTFVSENNLPSLVQEIRRALDDDPRHPKFLRTLHGFGYAFAAIPPEGTPARDGVHSVEATYWIVADRQIRLAAGENILGRDSEASVWFDVPGVSRRHARITIAASGAVIEDLGSKNGTWVRGERIGCAVALGDGDDVRLGPLELTFRVRGAARSTEVFA